MAHATLSTDYQVTIPEEVLREVSLEPGQQVRVVARSGVISLVPDRQRAPFPAADEKGASSHLGHVKGWLDDDDPFFSAIEDIVESRSQHVPRVLRSASDLALIDE